MIEYAFIASCTYGTESTEVIVELSNRDGAKLERYGKKSEYYYDGFENCEPLSDIYKKVYKIAVEQMTEEIREAGEDDCCDDPDWVCDDTYACWVDFPAEFEDELED